MTTIQALRFRTLDVPLVEPFGIATGTEHAAHNVLVELELHDGTIGLGEAAPYPRVTGETQDAVLAAYSTMAEDCRGRDALRLRPLCEWLRESLDGLPCALAGIEIALLDALCRREQRSLWHYFGGREASLRTDLTLSAGAADEGVPSPREAALRAIRLGFDTLKIKIGRGNIDADARRVREIVDAAPGARLILDANASLSAEAALCLLAELGPARSRVVLFEQPTAREDTEGLCEVQAKGRVPVAADESVRSAADVIRLAARGGVSVINIKTAKSGLLGAWDMITVARAAGLKLMIGGMVETELSMSASACLAAGIGGFDFVDLDTPLFMGKRPLTGGYLQQGPWLTLSQIDRGHGVRLIRATDG